MKKLACFGVVLILFLSSVSFAGFFDDNLLTKVTGYNVLGFEESGGVFGLTDFTGLASFSKLMNAAKVSLSKGYGRKPAGQTAVPATSNQMFSYSVYDEKKQELTRYFFKSFTPSIFYSKELGPVDYIFIFGDRKIATGKFFDSLFNSVPEDKLSNYNFFIIASDTKSARNKVNKFVSNGVMDKLSSIPVQMKGVGGGGSGPQIKSVDLYGIKSDDAGSDKGSGSGISAGNKCSAGVGTAQPSKSGGSGWESGMPGGSLLNSGKVGGGARADCSENSCSVTISAPSAEDINNAISDINNELSRTDLTQEDRQALESERDTLQGGLGGGQSYCPDQGSCGRQVKRKGVSKEQNKKETEQRNNMFCKYGCPAKDSSQGIVSPSPGMSPVDITKSGGGVKDPSEIDGRTGGFGSTSCAMFLFIPGKMGVTDPVQQSLNAWAGFMKSSLKSNMLGSVKVVAGNQFAGGSIAKSGLASSKKTGAGVGFSSSVGSGGGR